MVSEAQKRAKKRYQKKCVDDKKYFCITCNKAFINKITLTRHMNSTVHNPKTKVHYECKCCNYNTHNKSYMKLHFKSKKHMKNSTV